MRHKYETRGIVLSRSPLGEANAFVSLLTSELGLVRARAQGVRASGAKLAPALATFAESSCVLVRGREGWRLAGAVLEESWFRRMRGTASRERAARVSGLVLRLVAGEAQEHRLFSVVRGFFLALSDQAMEQHDAAEMLAALRTLAVLGFDVGGISGDASSFAPSILSEISKDRARFIARINHGIAASGL